MDRALAIIPARGQSKGLPGKHLLRLGGKTLIERALHSAREATCLHRVIVSTEDFGLFRHAQEAGAEVLQRPDALATDECGMIPVLQHAVRFVEDQGERYDLIVLLQPTSPFRAGEDIDETVGLIDKGAYSAQTVVEAAYAPSKMMLLDEDGGEIAFMNEHEAKRDTRRQDYSSYQPSGAVYVATRDCLMQHGLLISHWHRGLIRPWERSLNINTPWDFEIARMVHRKLNPCRMCETAAQGGECTCKDIWP